MFSTASGRGVHSKKAHPNQHDIENVRVDVKACWTEEEIARLALSEAKLLAQNKPPRHINQSLLAVHPERSLEGIKGQRRSAEYKSQVQKFLRSLRENENAETDASSESDGESDGPVTASEHEIPSETQSASESNHLSFSRSLPALPNNSFNYKYLLTILSNAEIWGKPRVRLELTEYLKLTFPPRVIDKPHRIQPVDTVGLSSRKRRRTEYAVTQKSWKKNQGRCIKEILEGKNISKMPAQKIMEPFWKQVLERQCNATPHLKLGPQNGLELIWSPITIEEINESRLRTATSPGPDGITSKQLKATPAGILARIFNLILWCESSPDTLRGAYTIFIPKIALAEQPGDYRPITIPSVLSRQLHKILAKRLLKYFSLDPRQRAFQHFDGCADNAILFDLLLKDQHRSFRSCHIASLDVGKAFDSVAHPSIFHLLEQYGFPKGFVNCIKDLYSNSYTYLQGDNWRSGKITPTVGVKQGDPLSPLLFNLIIDGLLRSLPNHIAARIDETPINALAFADDLVLAASTKEGLQELLNNASTYLHSCGLSLNPAKCATISIQGQPKQRRTVIVPSAFTVDNSRLPSLRRTDTLKYLGLVFDCNGRLGDLPKTALQDQLNKLTRAPLKPQQRLHALRTVLIPRLYHQITLSQIRRSYLDKIDATVRGAIRQWLRLPADTPIGYFYTTVKDGGLGINSVRWVGPLLRYNRLMNVELPNLENNVVINYYIATEIDVCLTRLKHNGTSLKSKTAINNMWAEKLYQSVDGSGLAMAKHHHEE